MTACLQVTTTLDSQQAAEALADTLVRERFVACAQVSGPIRATYRWQGTTEVSTEWLCVMKTTRAAYPGLEARIKALHSYQQPEIIAVPIEAGDPGYLDWIQTETRDA